MAVSMLMTSTLKLGIECCRRGDWTEGLRYLGKIAEEKEQAPDLPGVFYSYLGYGIALCQQRVEEGLKLCQHSIKVEFYQVENYVNLARTCLLAQDRKGAIKAVRGRHRSASESRNHDVASRTSGPPNITNAARSGEPVSWYVRVPSARLPTEPAATFSDVVVKRTRNSRIPNSSR